MTEFIINNNPETPGQKFIRAIKQPRVYWTIFAFALLLAVLASMINRYYVATKKNERTKLGLLGLIRSRPEKTIVSNLDGLRYSEGIANRHALGVMIENHPESRPQFGLTDAGVVYEAIAEGGITRFLAIFGPKIPPLVGPVRSARTYYLDWCLEYGCFYAHVGGNIDALDLIPKLGIKDLDQFRYGVKKYGRTYYRIPKKGAAVEHTMFADPVKLYEIAHSNGWSLEGGYPSINFKQDVSKGERPASQQIAVEVSSKQFNLIWDYDSETNSYSRTIGGVAHKDGATGEQIKTKVVIVQEVPAKLTVTRINEQGLIMDTVGQGKARIFQDGSVVEGTWKKEKQEERTIFYDGSGREIRYNPGQRWITIVSPGSKVTVTQPTAATSP